MREGEGAMAKGLGVLLALVAAIGWGSLCGMFRTPFWPVAFGGIVLAALAFWLERASLANPETVARKDFQLILAAGIAFFAIIGVGVASFSALIATWYLPRL
jgi:hypothetical protein